MSNIVELKTRDKIANSSCVEMLEHWLQMAKDGEINQVCLAALAPDNSSWTQYSDLENIQAMIGAIEIIKYKLMANAVE